MYIYFRFHLHVDFDKSRESNLCLFCTGDKLYVFSTCLIWACLYEHICKEVPYKAIPWWCEPKWRLAPKADCRFVLYCIAPNLTPIIWHHYDFNCMLGMTSINEKMLTVFSVICNSYFAYVKLWVLNKRYTLILMLQKKSYFFKYREYSPLLSNYEMIEILELHVPFLSRMCYNK